jgi:hypothetical protein
MLAIREAFNTVNESLFLTQPGCNCFSVKYGLDNKLWIHPILEGEDADGNDIMIHKSSFGLKNNEGYFVEDSLMRPLTCPTE